MTLYINGLDSGSAGATANTPGIASSGYGFKVLGATTGVFTATNTIDGALAVQFVRTSGSSYYFAIPSDGLNTNDVSFSLMFTYTGAMPGTNDYLFDVRVGTVGSTTSLVRCIVNSTNHPFIQLSGSTLGTATGSLVLGTQYRVDCRVHINASAGSIHCDFYPANSVSTSFTGFSFTSQNTGSSTIKNVNLGAAGTNTVSSGTTVYDLPRIDDSQSSTYFGPNTATAPTCGAGVAQSVNARDAVALTGTVTWAAGHSGTVAWTGGTTPITNSTSLSATIADIGSPALTAGNALADDTVTYTLTATQDDAQTATATIVVTRKCGNRWMAKGTKYVCQPLLKDR